MSVGINSCRYVGGRDEVSDYVYLLGLLRDQLFNDSYLFLNTGFG